MSDQFNWLHLSDLHFGQQGQGPLWSNVREAFFRDLADLHERCGPWHAVLFTGDLVYSGRAEQFERLETDVLSRLWAELEKLGSGDAVLLAVPGNHDLARPDTKAKPSASLRQLTRLGGLDEIADEFWGEADTEYHHVIDRALADYSNWWNKTPWRKGALIQPGRLPGDFATTLAVGSRRIGIAGLNTTFLQLSPGDFVGRLVWHPEQLRAVCGDPADWVKDHDACLLLTHQAREWLTDESRNVAGAEINPAGRFASHLFGHMHASDLTGTSKGGGPQRFEWQASSLFGMEKYGESSNQVDRKHGYVAGRLEFEKQDISIRCWPRTASRDQNGWRLHADHSAALLDEDERTQAQVARVNRKLITPDKSPRKSKPGPAVAAAERALLKTYLRAARSQWDIVDLAGLPEDDRHIAMQKFVLRQLYMPLRLDIEDVDGRALPERLEKRRERMRRDLARRSRDQSEDGVGGTSLGKWLRATLSKKSSRGASKSSNIPRLMILGDPGGGKSTLLRWFATACLLRLENSADFIQLPDADTLPKVDWVPILIRCRDLDKATLGRDSLEDILRQTLPRLELATPHIDKLIALLRKRLGSGTAIIMIDALDEISDPNERIAFCERVESIARHYSSAPILATSRIVGYREMHRRIGGGFAHGTIEDLALDEKDAFIDRWCEVTISDSARRISEADALRRGIHENDRVARLTGNPMLLTTMALVQRKVGKLPPQRHKLYWEAVDLLLRWRASPDEPPLDADEALPQLEYVAYAMCDQGVQRLRRDEVIELLTRMRSAYPDIRAVHRQSPDLFLADLERRTGLLIEVGHVQHDGHPVPVYEFRHLTFQEYLAALSLVRGHFPGHTPGSSLADRVAPLAGRLELVKNSLSNVGEMSVSENWRETLRLVVASCNDDDVRTVLDAILKPIHKSEARPRAILAAQCLADEPNVMAAQADMILATFATHVEKQDGTGREITTVLDGAAIELAKGVWSIPLRTHLAREFLRAPSETRLSVGGVFAAVFDIESTPKKTDGSNWLAVKANQLLSIVDEEATAAALAIMQAAWRASNRDNRQADLLDSPPPLVSETVRNLTSLLTRGPAIALAGSWALMWMANILHFSPSIWNPTPEQLSPFLVYLSEPAKDIQASICLIEILGIAQFGDAVQPLLEIAATSSGELYETTITALARIGGPSTLTFFRDLLDDQNPTIRKAAFHALASQGGEADQDLIAKEEEEPWFWLDPHETITRSMIDTTSRRLGLPRAEVRRRYAALARKYGIKIERYGSKASTKLKENI